MCPKLRLILANCSFGPSPNVSQGGRGAAKSSSIRQRSELNIRKSSYGPSPAGLLAVFSPKVSIFCQGKTHHSPTRRFARFRLATASLSAAHSCNLQLPVHLAEQLQVRIARRQR